MPRFLSCLLLLLAVVATGLAQPVFAADAAYVVKPAVMVYPPTSNGSSIDREASSRLATIIATGMADTRKATVIPPPPGTERKDYLTVARRSDADYYIAGFLSPLGNGVSIIEQVVSTVSGVVVYSTTMQINTYGEAAGMGADLAAFVAQYANRSLERIPTPPPAASATPRAESEKNGTSTNIGGLFRRKKAEPAAKPAPSATVAPRAVAPTSVPAAQVRNTSAPAPAASAPPAATPVPVAAAPAAAGVSATPIFVGVAGSADETARSYAASHAAQRAKFEVAASRSTACEAAPPTKQVASGTLTTRSDAQFGGASATFELLVSTCGGKTLYRREYTRDAGGADAQNVAIGRAVDAVIEAYVNRRR